MQASMSYTLQLREQNRALKARVKLLERTLKLFIPALAFYANPETYFAIAFLGDPPCGPFVKDFEKTRLGLKPGKKARAALLKGDKILNPGAQAE